jgi:hypothetical protein
MDWNNARHLAEKISTDLEPPDTSEIKDILAEAAEQGALTLQSANRLLNTLYARDFDALFEIISETARDLRRQVFGNRVAVMAPVEVSNHCSSDCRFCGWRVTNTDIPRTRISETLVLEQIEHLLDLGITYIELVGGDNFPFVRSDVPVLTRSVREIMRKKGQHGQICVCSMAVTQKHYREWKDLGVDAMFVWQETYDPALYARNIPAGPKSRGLNDDWSVGPQGNGYLFRAQSQERALRAGLNVGLGFMLGLNPNLNFEFSMAGQHIHALLEQTAGMPGRHPLIIGMPTWNNITTPHTDLRPQRLPDMEKAFPFLAAVYFLSLPKGDVWIFPNCRVSLKTQIDTIELAGPFTSTEVKLGPGGYLPSILRERESQGIDCALLRRRISKELGRSPDDLESLESSLDEGEQFRHHFHVHEVYVKAMQQRGLDLVPFELLRDQC